MHRGLFSIIGLSALLAAGSAQAISITTFTDRSTFESASGPLTSEGFNDSPPLPSFFGATVPSLDFGTFSIFGNGRNFGSAAAFLDPELISEGSDAVRALEVTQVTFTFGAAVKSFGLDINGLDGSPSSAASFSLDGGTTSFGSLGASSGSQFFGFTNTDGFTVLDIFVSGGGTDPFGFDNLQFASSLAAPPAPTPSPVPLPASLPLMLAGLGFLAMVRRRNG